MENEKPFTLEELANQTIEAREVEKRVEKERISQLEQKWQELNKTYKRLTNDPAIIGALIEKAAVVNKIFPSTVVSVLGPSRERGEFYAPKLVLSVPQSYYKYVHQGFNDEGAYPNRVWENLFFYLKPEEKIHIIHKFGSSGYVGNHYIVTKNDVWSLEGGIPIDRFPLELDQILLRFCDTYKQFSIGEQRTYLVERIDKHWSNDRNNELFGQLGGCDFRILCPKTL